MRKILVLCFFVLLALVLSKDVGAQITCPSNLPDFLPCVNPDLLTSPPVPPCQNMGSDLCSIGYVNLCCPNTGDCGNICQSGVPGFPDYTTPRCSENWPLEGYCVPSSSWCEPLNQANQNICYCCEEPFPSDFEGSFAINPNFASCDNSIVTFTASGLDTDYRYVLSISYDETPTDRIHLQSFDTGTPSFTFSQRFDPDGICPHADAQTVVSGEYQAFLTQIAYDASRRDVAEGGITFVRHSCTLIPQNPIYPNQQGQITLYSSYQYKPYSVDCFPLGCTCLSPVTTDGVGLATISITCTQSFEGSGQVVALAVDEPLDRCDAIFNVSEEPVVECISDSGDSGLCYENDSVNCRPPSEFDGQGDCISGFSCCVASDTTGFPPGRPCIGLTSEEEGYCGLFYCDLSTHYPDGWNPQTTSPSCGTITCGLSGMECVPTSIDCQNEGIYFDSWCENDIDCRASDGGPLIQSCICPSLDSGPACNDNLYANMLYFCCVPWPTSSRASRPQLPAGCTAFDGSQGIDTAIGCIPVTNATGLAGFILRFGIGIGGGVSLLLILFSALQIITSSGNPEKVKSGKQLLTASIGGLLLIIFSVFILEVVGVRILRLPGF